MGKDNIKLRPLYYPEKSVPTEYEAGMGSGAGLDLLREKNIFPLSSFEHQIFQPED